MFLNEEEILKEDIITEKVEETTNDVVEDIIIEKTEENKIKKPAKNKPDTSSAIAEEFLPENFNPFARPVNPRFANRREQEFEERVLQIKRVIKVTKGGRRFKFSALVVVGDRKGRVGYAIGKHIEVPEAIKKASRQAKKNIQFIKIDGTNATFPHEVIGHKGAARVMLKPASEGKGIIASDVVRAVVELAGYRNIYSKNLGTNNPLNVIIATIDGLLQMKTGEEIMESRKEFIKKEPKIINEKKEIKPIIGEGE